MRTYVAVLHVEDASGTQTFEGGALDEAEAVSLVLDEEGIFVSEDIEVGFYSDQLSRIYGKLT